MDSQKTVAKYGQVPSTQVGELLFREGISMARSIQPGREVRHAEVKDEAARSILKGRESLSPWVARNELP